jgi:hypothetical protein
MASSGELLGRFEDFVGRNRRPSSENGPPRWTYGKRSLARKSRNQAALAWATNFRRRGLVDAAFHRVVAADGEFPEQALAPPQVAGDQVVHGRVKGEMVSRIDPGDHGQNYSDPNDLHGVANAEINGRGDRLLQHALTWGSQRLGRPARPDGQPHIGNSMH